jgi:hypothetical protein
MRLLSLRSPTLGPAIFAGLGLLAWCTILGVLTAVAGCRSATGATVPFPPIGGTYSVTVLVTDFASGSLIRSDTSPGQISFNEASRSGAFTGSYSIGGILGYSVGQEEADGSLKFSAFGEPSSSPIPPLENDEFIANVIPGCDWSTATDGQMTGKVVQAEGGVAPAVTITGSIQVQCVASRISPSPVTSVVTLDASGFLGG